MMKAEEFIDKLFELLGEMHDDLQEHKCQAVEEYNRQITKLFEQSAAVKRALLEHGKMAMKGMKLTLHPKIIVRNLCIVSFIPLMSMPRTLIKRLNTHKE